MGVRDKISMNLNKSIEFSKFIESKLFSRYFLIEGIRDIKAFNEISEKEVINFFNRIYEIYRPISSVDDLKEVDVEDSIIIPILEYFKYGFIRQSHLGDRYIPDFALFTSEEEKQIVQNRKRKDLWKKSISLLEAKRGNRELDTKNKLDLKDPTNPSNKMISYIESIWRETGRRIKHGFLTNGKEWRLYTRDVDIKSKKYLSFRFEKLMNELFPQKNKTVLDKILKKDKNDDNKKLKLSHLGRLVIFFLSPNSFKTSYGIENQCLIDLAISENQLWEKNLTDILKKDIFIKVVPILANGFYKNLETNKKEEKNILYKLYHDIIIFLYRILFIMHAEDRGLLPIGIHNYKIYSLQKIRKKISIFIDSNKNLSDKSYMIYNEIGTLCRLINEGDKDISLNNFNGKFFSKEMLILDSLKISDPIIIQALDFLSREHRTNELLWINYSELSVKHLGNIYESLLEFNLDKATEEMVIIKKSGKEKIIPKREIGKKEKIIETISKNSIFLTNKNSERKATGSYFTPDYIVRFIVENTIGKYLSNIKEKFENIVEKNINLKKKNKINYTEIGEYDPLKKMLQLKILDPAVGSGHFLVYVFEYLSEYAETLLNFDEINEIDYIYEPLLIIKEKEIDRSEYIDRLIIKKCLYGIDINELSVELAKLSLWLSSFSPKFPLSFLDHHIKVGNSLLSYNVEELYKLAYIKKKELMDYFGSKNNIKEQIKKLINSADISVDEVHKSQKIYNEIQLSLKNIKLAFNIFLWSQIENSRKNISKRNIAEKQALIYLKSGKFSKLPNELRKEIQKYARKQKFFHLGLEFFDLLKIRKKDNLLIQNNFDFIVSNPPYGGDIDNKKIIKFLKKHYHSHKETAAYFINFILSNSQNYGFIIPKSLAFYSSWEKSREDIINKSIITNVLDTGLAFEDVNYETIIINGRKKKYIQKSQKNLDNKVSISYAYPLKTILPKKSVIIEGEISNSNFSDNNIIIFRGILKEEQKILEKIQFNSIQLEKIVESKKNIFRGVYVPNKRKKDIVNDLSYIYPTTIPEDAMIWIDRVPHVKKYVITKYHLIRFIPQKDKNLIKKAKKTMVPRIFIKVLRGNQLYSYPDSTGQICTTGKLVNIVIPKKSQYSLNFLCGIINSPYPSFYLQNKLYSKTTETSRVMDYPYSKIIPIPKIHFNAKDGDLKKGLKMFTNLFTKKESTNEIRNEFNEILKNQFINQRSHILHNTLTDCVEKIISLKKRRRQMQFSFVDFLMNNYEDNISNIKKKIKYQEKLQRKMGQISWYKFFKFLKRNFNLDRNDVQFISKDYKKKKLKVEKFFQSEKKYNMIINKLATLNFNLTEEEEKIVIDSLAKR